MLSSQKDSVVQYRTLNKEEDSKTRDGGKKNLKEDPWTGKKDSTLRESKNEGVTDR